ncbi:Ger(x)C family spore germination protein [Alteribacillus bidgolensis]|uniref:Spore germination protein n=1 Tax=Alteribacillus bidgolensis TaxID=930129 RepID=A0A1G8C0T3_9BACI|nr:Ger(x)C family spore germination protein [Alteribacillus bidgolensis]SDH39072.1 spore germination protein [Alteribacillus bidgolensis]
MKKKVFISLSVLILITGCLDTQIIDEILLIQTVGIDKHEEQKLKYSVTYPFFLEQGEESTLNMEQISVISETPEEARSLLNTKAQQPLRYGQVRVIMFGKEVAEEGLEKYVKSFYRNPRVGSKIFLSLTEGKTEEILNLKGEEQQRIGMYFSDLIEQNIEFENIPETNMHLFLFDLYSDGKDAFLPLIKKVEGEPKLIGSALFDFDRYVDHIDMNQTYILKQLQDGSEGGTNQFMVEYKGEKEYVVIDNVFTEVQYKEKKRTPYPEYDIELQIQGEITDNTGNIDLSDSNQVAIIEQSVGKQIKTESEKLIKRFQELKIDPLGFGEKYRSKTRNWKPNEWKENIYPKTKSNVKVDLEILQSGAIE